MTYKHTWHAARVAHQRIMQALGAVALAALMPLASQAAVLDLAPPEGLVANIAQVGAGNDASIVQTGKQQLAHVSQIGANNGAAIGQMNAGEVAIAMQYGVGNHVGIMQAGINVSAIVRQVGAGNSAFVGQFANNVQVNALQGGLGNQLIVLQTTGGLPPLDIIQAGIGKTYLIVR